MKIQLFYKANCKYCKQTTKNIIEAITQTREIISSGEFEGWKNHGRALRHEVFEPYDFFIKKSKKKIEFEKILVNDQAFNSPTVLVDGKDIQKAILKKQCDSCTKIFAAPTCCRTFVWKDKTYSYPPVEMIVEAIKNA